MEWFFLVLVAAILASFSAITEKRTLLKEHAMEFATVLTLFLFFYSFSLLPFADFTMSTHYFYLLILIGIIDAIGFLYLTKSFRHMEISEASPLLTFAPVIVAFLAFFFLGEVITTQQIGGIALVIFGAYILEFKHDKHEKVDLFKPLKMMMSSKYIHYVFFALFLYAIAGIMWRFVLNTDNPNHIDPYASLFIIHLVIAFTYIVLIYYFHDGLKGIVHGVKSAGKWIALTGVFLFISRIFLVTAVTLPVAKIALITAIKRLSSLFSTIVGGELYHDHNLPTKMLASIIMVVGAIFIVL
jgi:drug/metabolite transporter (DMT)-like permease